MKILFLAALSAVLVSFKPNRAGKDWRERTERAEYIHQAMKQVTDVIVHDIYSPPVASRTYAYTSIAAYETVVPSNPNYVSLAGQLRGFTAVPQPVKGRAYSYPLAAVHAMLTVGKALVTSENLLEGFHNKIILEFRQAGVPADVINNSIAYGKAVANHILDWASHDNYKQTRSFPKYFVTDAVGSWQPTPPAYLKAIEPHWNMIRPFLLDSAAQFKPLPPTPFSPDSSSLFYKEAMTVRNTGLQLTAEQQEIANFWDCNPFKMNINGHVTYATRKISPGGHWINITALACRKVKAGYIASAEAYACLAITMADGFISCWDEKYRSSVIRPETYINRYIDKDWTPLLQTPPFPEYTSGHSVISTAASFMLTRLFGENFAFEDSTEVEFKLPIRNFSSFEEAAKEAAISRLYGGIHYETSIINGIAEGREIANFIIRRLRTKK